MVEKLSIHPRKLSESLPLQSPSSIQKKIAMKEDSGRSLLDAPSPLFIASTLQLFASWLPLTASILLRTISGLGEAESDPDKFLSREKVELKKLEVALLENCPASVDDQLKQLALIEHLAQQYLQKAAEDGSEDDGVRLAEDTYELLGKIAATSGFEEINHRARYYDGLQFLVGGDEDGARSIFTDEVDDLPEAKAILETMGKIEKAQEDRQSRDRRRMLALSVLDIWSTYADEGQAYETDQAKGVLGVALGTIRYYTESGNKTMPDQVAATWNQDRDLIHEIQQKIKNDEAETVDEALQHISGEPGKFQGRAQGLLDEAEKHDNSGSYMLAHLIRYVSEEKADPALLQRLLKDADGSSARLKAEATPYAIYSFLKATEGDAVVKSECAKRLAALEKGKKLPGIVWDMIRSTGTDDLVQLAIMAGASKAGSFARLAALGRLERAGVTGYKALVLAYGAEVAVEGTAMWAMNTVYESMSHDTERVFEGKKLFKSWGANLIMISGLKIMGGFGAKVAPEVVKFADFVKDGEFTRAGMAMALGLNHLAGLGGMVGTTQLNEALGLSEAPRGGFKESLAHDVFSYIKYGLAQKGVDHVLGPNFNLAREERQEQIRQKEARLLKAAKDSKEKVSILENPLLAPLWMMMGMGGVGSKGDTLLELHQAFLKHLDQEAGPSTLWEDLSVISDYLQAKGDPRGEWIALEKRRKDLQISNGAPTELQSIEAKISKIRRKIQKDIKEEFSLNVGYEFEEGRGFRLKIDGRQNESVSKESIDRFGKSSYAALLTGMSINDYASGQEWILSESNLSQLRNLRVLSISNSGGRVAYSLNSILNSPMMPQLLELNLQQNSGFGNRSLEEIMNCKSCKNLKYLNLTKNGIDSRHSGVLLGVFEKSSLTHLRSLDLRNNYINNHDLHAIRRSPKFPNLVELNGRKIKRKAPSAP